MPGFALVPLTSSICQWRATDAEAWKADYKQFFQDRTIYGLSDKGDLVRLRQRLSGIDSHIADWECWISSVGEIGTLVMMVGALLS